MTKHNIWLDEVSAEEMGIRLTGALEISAPEMRVETVSVPGRNGDLHIYDGSFKNRTARVGAYVYRKDRVKEAFGEIYKWLLGTVGYRRLVTDDDGEHFMLARVKNGGEIAARLGRLAPFEIEFDCKPQRFLRSGEETVFTVTADNSGEVFFNPTAFPAKPLVHIVMPTAALFPDMTGNGTLSIGDSVIEIKEMRRGGEYDVNEAYFDAETQSAYVYTGGVMTNLNRYFYSPSGLSFAGGDQAITVSGDITLAEITPRWWEV